MKSARKFRLIGVAGAFAVVISGCASTSIQSENQSGPLIQPVVATTTISTPINLSSFATKLSAAVAMQNKEAFGIPTVTKGVAPGHTNSTDSDAATNVTTAPAQSNVNAFTNSLEGAAVDAYVAQNDLLDESFDVLVGTEDTVSRIAVSVDAVKATAATSTTTEVTADLYIVRTLSNGISWEEVVPYVSDVENVSGDVTSLIVQDDAWGFAQEQTEEPTIDESLASEDELNGVAPTPTPTPTPSSTPKPTPKPTLTAGPIDPTVVPNSAQSSATAASTPAKLTTAQRAKVVNYAKTYWKNYNPAYATTSNDCTNFASQALKAGGWAKVTGWYKDDYAWWYTGNPLIQKSYTWASASSFFRFATKSGRSTLMPYISNAQTGDIMQYDVDPAGMNHTMIVTAKGTRPYLTYHSHNRLNKPWLEVNKDISKNDKTPTWYVHRV